MALTWFWACSSALLPPAVEVDLPSALASASAFAVATVRAASSEADATLAGALINDVTPDGAAAKAGLAPGDVVTEFNGAPITSAVDLTAQVRAAAGGSTAELSYVRGGATHTVEVTLGTL